MSVPGERAIRAIMDAVGLPATAEAADADIPVAGTVIVVRDAAQGPEVLMIERPDRGSFAGAWVFPGGKLEPADIVAGAAEHDDARRAGARETREETGLVLDEPALVSLSCWEPPQGLPLRVRTWFFLAAAPAIEGRLVLSPDEAVSATWIRPEDVLARHSRGELTLYPPTWVTLDGLGGHADAASLVGSVGSVRRYRTTARRAESGPVLLWQDDVAYPPDADLATPGPRHRLLTGALPWQYLRSA